VKGSFISLKEPDLARPEVVEERLHILRRYLAILDELV
jgi:hypothetical protein